jgi:hypothetical protein
MSPELAGSVVLKRAVPSAVRGKTDLGQQRRQSEVRPRDLQDELAAVRPEADRRKAAAQRATATIPILRGVVSDPQAATALGFEGPATLLARADAVMEMSPHTPGASLSGH